MYPTMPDVQSKKFTGKERDAETGLDYFGARYFSGGQGRFTSADWSAKSEPVPYANLEDPQTLNLYGYVRNNSLSKPDQDGHEPSDLVYDGKANTLTLNSSEGKEIGSWPAGNNVAIHAPAGEGNGSYTNGPIEDGTYSISKADQHGATMHLNGSETGPYGSQGIVHIEGAVGATGKVMMGAGVHSGRSGPMAKTAGCIRTCTDAMRTINKTAKTDPLKTITVKNNDADVASWQSQAASTKAKEHQKAKANQSE